MLVARPRFRVSISKSLRVDRRLYLYGILPPGHDILNSMGEPENGSRRRGFGCWIYCGLTWVSRVVYGYLQKTSLYLLLTVRIFILMLKWAVIDAWTSSRVERSWLTSRSMIKSVVAMKKNDKGKKKPLPRPMSKINNYSSTCWRIQISMRETDQDSQY